MTKKRMPLYLSRLLLVCAALITPLISACSLNYGTEEDSVTQAPEFIFNNLQMTRVEKGKTTASVKAMQLEQYREEDAMYAKAVAFKLYNDEGKVSVEGSCGMLSADSESDIYMLFSNVEFNSYEQNMKVLAHNIKWDNNTEQLVCGSGEQVSISSGLTSSSDVYAKPQTSSTIQMTVDGTGFSASGASMSYVFSGSVAGTIITGNKRNISSEVDNTAGPEQPQNAPPAETADEKNEPSAEASLPSAVPQPREP